MSTQLVSPELEKSSSIDEKRTVDAEVLSVNETLDGDEALEKLLTDWKGLVAAPPGVELPSISQSQRDEQPGPHCW